MPFLIIKIICEQAKFTKNIYQKPRFNVVYTYFDNFLPYKTGMIHALLNRCFRLGYPIILFDRYFKLVLNKIHILKEKAPTVEKKCLRSGFPYLEPRSPQTRSD